MDYPAAHQPHGQAGILQFISLPNTEPIHTVATSTHSVCYNTPTYRYIPQSELALCQKSHYITITKTLRVYIVHCTCIVYDIVQWIPVYSCLYHAQLQEANCISRERNAHLLYTQHHISYHYRGWPQVYVAEDPLETTRSAALCWGKMGRASNGLGSGRGWRVNGLV